MAIFFQILYSSSEVYVCFIIFPDPKFAAAAQAGVIAACRLGGTLGYFLSGPLKSYYGDFLGALRLAFYASLISGRRLFSALVMIMP